MQGHGDQTPQALVGTHQRGGAISLMTAPADQVRDLNSYIGSISYSVDGGTVAVTSPRGGVVQMYDAFSGIFMRDSALSDVSGIAPIGDGFVVTAGTGELRAIAKGEGKFTNQMGIKWDNHLVAI
jgi:hypothetical protein